MARKKRYAEGTVGVRPRGDLVPSQAKPDAQAVDGQRTSLPPFEWFLELIGKPDFVLTCAFAQWRDSQNPYFVWQAIEVCTREKIEFPAWAREYLAECAQRMLSPAAAEVSDLRKVLPAIMGFATSRDRGNLLNPDGDAWRYLDVAARFAREIATGAKPSDALSNASGFLMLSPIV